VSVRRLCLRCGTFNEASQGAALEACPSCGVVYARAVPQPQVANVPAPKPSLVTRAGWFGALIGGAAGLAQIIMTHAEAESAPQQAAGMAMALAYAVIPYCIARALAAIGKK